MFGDLFRRWHLLRQYLRFEHQRKLALRRAWHEVKAALVAQADRNARVAERVAWQHMNEVVQVSRTGVVKRHRSYAKAMRAVHNESPTTKHMDIVVQGKPSPSTPSSLPSKPPAAASSFVEKTLLRANAAAARAGRTALTSPDPSPFGKGPPRSGHSAAPQAVQAPLITQQFGVLSKPPDEPRDVDGGHSVDMSGLAPRGPPVEGETKKMLVSESHESDDLCFGMPLPPEEAIITRAAQTPVRSSESKARLVSAASGARARRLVLQQTGTHGSGETPSKLISATSESQRVISPWH